MVIDGSAEEVLRLVGGGATPIFVTGESTEQRLHLIDPVQPVSDSRFTGQPLQTPLHPQSIVSLSLEGAMGVSLPYKNNICANFE